MRNAKIARALRVCIQSLLRERADKARFSLRLERCYRAEQERLLGEILFDNLAMRRMRSLIHSLEFEGGVAP